jgi:hypothetical protein
MATDSLKYNIIRPGYMRRPFKNVNAHFTTPLLQGTLISKRKIFNNFLYRLFVVYNRTHEQCEVKESFVFDVLEKNINFCLAEKAISGSQWDDEYMHTFDLFVQSFNALDKNSTIFVAETVNSIFTIPATINANTIFLNRWETEGGKMPLLFDLIHNLFISGLFQPKDFLKQYDFDLFFYQALPLFNEMIAKFSVDYVAYERLYVLYNLSFYYKAKSSAVVFSNIELEYYNRLQNRLIDLF